MNILFFYHLLPAPGEGFINCDLILRAPRLHLWRFTTACAVLRVCMCGAPRLYVPCFASVCKDANFFRSKGKFIRKILVVSDILLTFVL